MSLSVQAFDYLRNLVRTKSGIVLEAGKEYLVESRIGGLVRQSGLASIDELVERLKSSSVDPLHRRVVEVMTTNETSFFRDGHPFDVLRTHVLPALMTARSSTRQLNFWCGACSTGQEPYTVAMTMLESVPRLAEWKISFLCTDLSSEMVARCRAGTYSATEIGRGLPPALLNKYFDKTGTEWQAKKLLRDMMTVKELNLTQAWPQMQPVDIIFLRNVLIYFDTNTKKDILGRCRKLLKPDGYLYLGSAETPMSLDEEYERLPVDRSGCYRKKQSTVRAA